jgi:hypothetical protein
LLLFVLLLSLKCVFERCQRIIQAIKQLLNSARCCSCKPACSCLGLLSPSGTSKTTQYEVSMLDRQGSLSSDDAIPRISMNIEENHVESDTISDRPSLMQRPSSSCCTRAFHDSIGRSLIMLLLTVFVSTMTALVQFTSCLAAPGYPFAQDESENRWFYDGTQPCLGSRFTIASILLVPLSFFPLFLLHRMQKLITLETACSTTSLNPIETSALRYCTSLSCISSACRHNAFCFSDYFQIEPLFAAAAATGWYVSLSH